MPTTIIALPTASYPAGTHSLPSVTIPVGITAVTVAVSRINMLSTTLQISWGIELSQDGATNWLSWGGASLQGGVVIDETTGLPFPASSFSVALPNSSNTLRQIRGQATLNEAVTTEVTARLFP